MVTMTREENVFVINLGSDENRFTTEWVAELTAAFDEVSGAHGPRAVVMLAEGKFWSNGLDLDWMMEHPQEILPYIKSVQYLLVQCLTLPAYSVAVLQGHSFAAGALLALAQDCRMMRVDRGFFCLPEVDLGIPFTPGMSALIQGKLPKQTAHDSMITGRRYGGKDALSLGIVDQAVSEERLLGLAMETASEMAMKAGPTIQAIRTEMYRVSIDSLNSDAGLRLPSA